MNKRLVTILLPTLLFTSCGVFSNENKQESSNIEFDVTSASFLDEEGHLKISYTCNYETPFNVEGHEFNKLNVTGVLVSELDYNHQGYFTFLSPVINTSLKLEFFDVNNQIYISKRISDIKQYEIKVDPVIEYPEGYDTLYWSDEFDGDELDKSIWTYEIGNGSYGWGNNESEYYTDYNDTVSDGELIISAKRETIGGFAYTSTRIKTQHKVKFTYGYVEAKIALPAVTGMWPAFWMMPNNSVYGGWPHSGEIDIMEAKGRLAYISSSALHFSTKQGQHTYLTNEKSGHNITEYHKYAVDWKEDSISFFIDDYCYYSVSKSDWGTVNAQSSETAPFDQDFYLILNLAVGGHFDGYQLPPSDFTSCDMKIDYVRVFK